MATGLKDGVKHAGVRLPCKARTHRLGADYALRGDLQHLRRIWWQDLHEVGPTEPRLWVSWLDYSNPTLKNRFDGKKRRVRSSSWLHTYTFHRAVGVSLIVANQDLSVEGLNGAWVAPDQAYRYAREWLRAPGIERMVPARGSWWGQRLRGTFDPYIRGHEVSWELKRRCEAAGIFEPNPLDYHDGRIPTMVALRFQAGVKRVARDLERELAEAEEEE